MKNLLKIFAFAAGSSITSPASLSGGMEAFLLVLVNFFKIENFFLELIFGLFHMFLRVEKYLFFSALDCLFNSLNVILRKEFEKKALLG